MVSMFSTVLHAIQRLPKPLITLLPMTLTFLGPGLLIWLVAFHIPVHYPQETMAPYPDESPATMELGHYSMSAPSIATAAAANPHRTLE